LITPREICAFTGTKMIVCGCLTMSQLERVSQGPAKDAYHRATSWVVDDPAAQRFTITGDDGVVRELYYLPEEMNGKQGIFEWIVDSSGSRPVITH
jgi:hypothetical protein